jgi:CTP synthase (UTP-ammonia lyase)
MKSRLIALVGERDPAKTAHRGIEASLARFGRDTDPQVRFVWMPTADLTANTVNARLADATGIWCVPGSPYASTTGALLAIGHARVTRKAFLGTCGGFQHALMEFAQRVLGHPAAHAELDPGAPDPLIARLSCSLVGTTGRVLVTDGPRFQAWLGGAESTEEFHCNYGFNDRFAELFRGSALRFVAHDANGQVRAFRLDDHPFFVGTLFQPERRVLHGEIHPLVQAFLLAG